MSSNIIDNAQTQSADSQAVINPQMAIDLLKAGNKRFTVSQPLHRDLVGQVNQTATGQYPFAVILSCIDSRIPTEIIFDQGVGDIFNARVAGNFINQDILGSMEFACAVAGSKLIVVMGHTSCGAVKGACDHVELGNLTAMLDKIMPAVDSTETNPDEDRSSKNADFVNRVSKKNVELTIQNIHNQSPVLKDLY
ncbi:MAG: carbonic anhydrase family protein, partial [Bacteroidota bacterium]